MRSSIILAICALTVLLLYEASAVLVSTKVIRSGGFIGDEVLSATKFGIRIADMMADIINPNFDDSASASRWQGALNDLAEASPNGEITHVQMRIWEEYQLDSATGAVITPPHLGSSDAGQEPIMDNWQRWFFGIGNPLLPYGPSAAERIHQTGFNMELSISVSWTALTAYRHPVFNWGAREADYSDFDGELFLQYYMDNVLRPVADFLARPDVPFVDGDILMLGFEMVYPTADFTWLHNDRWASMINEIRGIFRGAGKNILLTIDHAGWFDDSSLGYNAVKLLNPDAPITPEYQGISGATYLGALDFISVSWWLSLVLQTEVPTTWSDADIPWVTEAWFSNKNFEKVGTGYSGVPAVAGRDMIADLRGFSLVMGKRVLMNTGWENRHGMIATNPRRPSATPDAMEQRVAWASQLRAIGDPRSNASVWNAGQDFERYAHDKTEPTTRMDASWRNAPAETAIIEEIRAILSAL